MTLGLPIPISQSRMVSEHIRKGYGMAPSRPCRAAPVHPDAPRLDAVTGLPAAAGRMPVPLARGVPGFVGNRRRQARRCGVIARAERGVGSSEGPTPWSGPTSAAGSQSSGRWRMQVRSAADGCSASVAPSGRPCPSPRPLALPPAAGSRETARDENRRGLRERATGAGRGGARPPRRTPAAPEGDPPAPDPFRSDRRAARP